MSGNMPLIRALNLPLALQLESLWMHEDVRNKVDQIVSADLRKLIPTLDFNQMEFDISVKEEFIPVEGNLCATDDPEADQALEQQVKEQLEAGNIWAWCNVGVHCTWNGFTGEDYLGGCSYESQEDFVKDAYYSDMCRTAFNDLIRQIKEAGWHIQVNE